MYLPRHSALLFLGAGALMLAEPALAAFGGKVKNIRIRERNNTDGYRVVVVVQDDSASSIGDYRATVEFEPLDDGPEIEPLELADPQRQRLRFSTEDVDLTVLQDDGTAPVTITVMGAEGALADEVALDLTPCVSGCAWEEAAWGETGKLKARLKADDDADTNGTLEAQIFDEDRGWDSGVVSSVNFNFHDQADDGLWGERNAKRGSFSGKLVTTFGVSEDTAGGGLAATSDPIPYQVTTTLYDIADNAVDVRSERLTIGGDALDEGISSSKLKQRRKGDYKTVAYTVSSGAQPIQGLSTEISTADGESLLTTFDEAPVGTERQFTFTDLAFDGDVRGAPLSITVTLRDESGGTIMTREIVEDGEVEDEATQISLSEGEVGLDEGSLRFDSVSEDGSVWDLTFAVTGDLVEAVHDVELQFNEPFEGPSPQENPLAMPLTAEWQKWADTFDPGVDLGDQDLTVDQILFTEDGQVVEEIRWTGPVGATFKNGQGTRGAATQSSSSAKLL